MELVIGAAGLLLALVGLVHQVAKSSKRSGDAARCRDAGLRLINATGHCIAALQEAHELKPRFARLPPSQPLLHALDRARAHLVEATAARAELRASASAEVGDAADALLDRLLEAVNLVQAPKGRADWDHLWGTVGESLRTFERTAGSSGRSATSQVQR